MAHKLLAEWRIRAVESGYIQEIVPGIVAGLVQGANPDIGTVDEPVSMENQGANSEFSDANYGSGVPAHIPHAETPAFSTGSGA